MLSSPFFRRLFVPYLLLICAAIGVVGIVGAQRLHSSYLNLVRQSLRDETLLMARILGDDPGSAPAAELNARVDQLGRVIARRITLVGADGTVIADNEADPARMENHRLRPEIVTAASQGEGDSIRPSGTLHEDLMYFARRVQGANAQSYYLRLAVPLRELDHHLRALYAGIAVAAGLSMLGAAVICYYFARRHAGPLVELTRFAEALRRGDLSRRIVRKGDGEIGSLALALDAMADSLSRLLTQTSKDKLQLLAVLSSMSEGVIATDTQQHILLSNAAAAGLLDLPDGHLSGRLLWEMVRHESILQATTEVLQSRERKIVQLGPLAGRHLDVAISTFPPAAAPEGLVIVMHDATQSVRYQELRKEFVANVSHELRTPLTAIKGFAETLRNGAMQDPVRGPQYLATIERHADQLTNLVNDLLELSRLESQPGLPRLVPVDVGQTVRKAVELLRPVAERKRQSLEVRIDPRLSAVAGNPDYLERAVANLVDNAVKYTPEGGAITICARSDATHVIVEVMDNGIGIPADDLPRVFERFYRVDRSRSRDMGGTGLGLSIVKHIAQAHRGTIEVSSTPERGSCFRLRLPPATPLAPVLSP